MIIYTIYEIIRRNLIEIIIRTDQTKENIFTVRNQNPQLCFQNQNLQLMLKFYQWAKKTKLTQSSNQKIKNIQKQPNGFIHRPPSQRRQTINHTYQTIHKQSRQRVGYQQNRTESLGKITLFNNAFIRQKIKQTQTERIEEKIKEKFRYQSLKAQDYQVSVQKFLLKRIHENMQKSENEKSQKERHSRLRRSNRKYKTIQSDHSSAKAAQFITNITANSISKDKKNKSQLQKWAQTSNLIEIDKSILNHIIRKQKEYQQKSLKIISFCSKNSQNTTHRPSLSKIHAYNPKQKTQRTALNRSQYMKSFSISKQRSSSHKINLKGTIQNDINGWNHYQKEDF